MRTRVEHLAWCKERALEYVDRHDLANAVASMMSDLNKHEETRLTGKMIATLGMVAAFAVIDGDSRGVRRWIEGFN
jgi:hypothetical protein